MHTTHKAKASAYTDVDAENLYSYIRSYAREISAKVEPAEDGTGNSYKAIRDRMVTANRAQLKAIAADLETVCKRLDWIISGQY